MPIAALLLLAAVLNLWALDVNGYANEYYSAAVRSMTESWSAFLYGSFDASNVMTVDKPPLSLWIQALSARVFGFSSLSMLVPQALMGVASVGLTYDIVRRRFGRTPGLVAGVVLALTPISVAISRHNNPDALLILCCVGALWALLRGLEDGRTRWLVLSGALVGLGFEAKMAAAFMVVPGIVVAWIWTRRTILPLLAGGAAMTATALAWPVVMWLTPAGDRPWISGTSDNSIWSLILGYNGLGRLAGQAGGGPGGAIFGGETGPLRLIESSLGGQAGWLLGVALISGVALLFRRDRGWLIAVGGAFLTTAVAFSFAGGIFHPYYVSLLAPFTAMLVGAGAAELPSHRRLAVAAIAAGVAVEVKILLDNPGSLAWLAPVLIAAGCGAAVLLLQWRRAALAGALAALLIAPAAWSVQTLGHATNGTFPAGGAQTAGMPFGRESQELTAALDYAEAHGGTIAISSQSGAAAQVIDGRDVVAIGGFSGNESQVTTTWLADAVRAGKVRYVLTTGSAGFDDGRTGSRLVMATVESSCRPVRSVDGLYDCQRSSIRPNRQTATETAHVATNSPTTT